MDVVRDIDCDYVEEQNLVSAYLAGRLSDEEADAFEKHYFGCETHWAEVRAGEEVRTAVRRGDAISAPDTPRPPSLATWRILAIAATVAAATLGALLLVRTFRTGSSTSASKPIDDVASAALGSRTTEARLSLDIPHVPLTRGVENLDRTALRRALAEAQVAKPSADNARAIGLAQLLLGDLDEAVRTLGEACHTTYRNDALVCSDLAAAYLARADGVHGQPHDRERALDAAIEAVHRNPSLPVALFNRALARERASLRGTAAADWREYLEHDKSSGWAAEARQHSPADKGSSLRSWPAIRERLLHLPKDKVEIARIVRAFPDRSHRFAAEELLGSWARTGDESKLATAGLIADAYFQLSQDPLLQESIAFIRGCDHSLRDLVTAAHLDYARGRQLSSAGHYEAAVQPLQRARAALAKAGSPFTLIAATEGIAARFNRNDMVATLKALEPLSVATRRYPVLYARTRWLIGLAELSRGRPAEALDAYSEAEKTYARIGEGENAAFLDSLLAEVYAEIGEAQIAETYRYRGLRALESVGSVTRRYVALSSLADEVRRAGLPRASAAAFEEAALVGKSAETSDIVADASASAARAAHGRGDRIETERLLAEAEALCAAIEDPILRRRERAEIQVSRAEISYDSISALQAFDEAEAFFQLRDDLPRLVEIRLGRADRFLEMQQPRLARRQLEAGVELLERERRDLSHTRVLLGFFQAREQLFDRAIQLAADDGDVETAAWTAERARARALLEIASRSTNKNHFPDEPLRPTEISQRLAPDTAIVELSVLSDRVLSFVYRLGDVSLCSSRVSHESIAALMEVVQAPPARTQVTVRQHALAQLFQLVLEPALPRILTANRVIIVPDKELCGLPFAELRGTSGRLLLEDYEFGVAPSASFYLSTRVRKSSVQTHEVVLVVADPVPPPALASELPRLPETHSESSELENLYPKAVVLSGLDATRSRFLSLAQGAAVIHFAGHALLGPGGTMPGLVLSAEPTDPTPSVLYASDVMSLNLSRTKLVVLGACNTASGERRGPEGVISMASAFLAAGVPTVLGTLAPVDDATAARLLSRFHMELARTRDVYAALRAAQLAEASRTQQSDSWSAFQLIGG